MTVAELIEELSKANPTDLVLISPDTTFTNAFKAQGVEHLDNNPGVMIL